MATDAILRRIQAALNIAADERAGLGERENAAAFAAALMARHSVDLDALRASRGEQPQALTSHPYAVPNTDGYGKARAQVAAHVARAFGVHAIHKPSVRPRPYTIVLVGPESDVSALRQLLPLILAQAAYAAAADSAGRRTRADWLPAFLLGYGATVAQRIAQRRPAPEPDRPGQPGTAVVLTRRAEAIDAYIADRFGELGSLSVDYDDANANQAGRRAGQRAHLGDSGVTPAGTRPALPQ